MTPHEFKSRYLKGLKEGFREAPDDVRAALEQRFNQFIEFPPTLLKASSLPQPTQDFLSQVGLPKAAAPALNFHNLYEARPDLETHHFFKDYFLIGRADGRRLLAIDKECGDVVCFDMSDEDVVQHLFVNSSLEALAECLCLFQEYRDRNALEVCLEAMRQVDSRLSDYYSFWEEETQNFFDNIVDRLNEAAKKA